MMEIMGLCISQTGLASLPEYGFLACFQQSTFSCTQGFNSLAVQRPGYKLSAVRLAPDERNAQPGRSRLHAT